MDKELKVVIAGGGTSGHVQPSVAVVQAIRRRQPASFLWLGEKGSREEEAAKALQIGFFPIRCGKLHRRFTWKNINMPFRALAGYGQAMLALKNFKPDVIFSKAGYVAVPTVLSAATLRIPVVIHESDTVMGLANRVAKRFAKKVCVGFPAKYYKKNVQKKLVYTGNPFFALPNKPTHEESYNHFKLEPKLPTLLVFGGSQGSLSITKAVCSCINELLNFTQVIHQTGNAHLAMAMSAKEQLSKDKQQRYIVQGYFERPELEQALSIGNLALSRTGANAIADFSYFGVPMVMVPLPSSAGNHQSVNAKYVAELGGGIVQLQSEMTRDRLLATVRDLLMDKESLHQMSEKIKDANPHGAADKIANTILEVVKR